MTTVWKMQEDDIVYSTSIKTICERYNQVYGTQREFVDYTGRIKLSIRQASAL